MKKTVQKLAFGLLLATGLTANTFAQNLAIGLDFGLMLCADTAKTFGLTDNLSIGNVVAVGADKQTAIVLKADGTVWTWGSNLMGALGNGSTTSQSKIPVQVSGLTNVTAIASGGFFTFLALKSDGTVWTWGEDIASNTAYSNIPVKVNGLANITAIAVGDGLALALKSDSTVWYWGGPYLAPMTATPVQVKNLSSIVKIHTNSFNNGGNNIFSMALKADGTLWAWGYNSAGQLGIGTNSNGVTDSIPAQVLLSSVKDFALGNEHAVAVKTDGTVWAWGGGMSGQVTGTLTFVTNTPISAPGNITNAIKVYAGRQQSYAVLADGTVKSWGRNSDGLLATYNINYNQVGFATAEQLCLLESANPQVPAAPSNLTATPTNSILLSWQDNSNNEDGFYIESTQDTTNGSWAQIASVNADSTRFHHTGLNPGETYFYRVRAYNANGNSDYSSVASALEPTSTGIAYFNKSLSVSIHPNPANTSFVISNVPNQSIITITDLVGKQVYSTTANSTELSINTSGFANGVYLVNVTNNGAVVTKKLVINK